eukprot:9834-Heterococcus_DN1.PRE.14
MPLLLAVSCGRRAAIYYNFALVSNFMCACYIACDGQCLYEPCAVLILCHILFSELLRSRLKLMSALCCSTQRLPATTATERMLHQRAGFNACSLSESVLLHYAALMRSIQVAVRCLEGLRTCEQCTAHCIS